MSDPIPKTPKTIRAPIEDMLREDLARAMRAIRKLHPDAEPSPAMLQRLADHVRMPLAHIDEWATSGYMKVGRLLLQIKDRIPHGGWMRLFKDGRQHVERPVPMSVAKAEALMRLVEHKVFKEPEVLRALPLGSWRTLDELTRVPAKILRQAVKAGRVQPTMTRAEAVALQRARQAANNHMPVAVDPFRAIRAALAAYTGDREALAEFLHEYLQKGGR